MKKILIACLAFALFALAPGCKKDLTTPILHSPTAVTGFAVSASTIVLSSANDSVTVAVFNWPTVSYGLSVPVTYTLLIDQPSDTSGTNGWANAISTTIANDSLSKSWLGTDFNHLLNMLQLPNGQASNIVARLVVNVNQSNGLASNVTPLYADIPMTVTPYHVVLIYPKLYVAGDFLNPTWTQIDQPGWILTSVLSNSVYEGYVNFTNAGNSFKLCTEADWNGTNYGWGGSLTTISGSSSAGNCYTAGPAYSRVDVDETALTITYTPTQWYIAGDFNGWSTTATPMTFSTSTNQWTATGITMAAGGTFKFISNSDWTNSYGLDSHGNLLLGTSSGNVISPKAGTFTVTLDLSQGQGNYAYSIN
jgi:hypothetical protein